MHMARVHYTVYGDETQRVDTQKGLKSAVPFIRRELSRRLRLRYVPELIFEFDKALEYGNRIDSLLRQLNEDQIRNEDQSSDD